VALDIAQRLPEQVIALALLFGAAALVALSSRPAGMSPYVPSTTS
jgi:hypothetical protein